MATLTATDPLVKVSMEGKAEIVNGRIEEHLMTGDEPGYAADEIYVSLREYAVRQGTGRAVADGKGFLCDLPNRTSFHLMPRFIQGQAAAKGSFPNRLCSPLKSEAKRRPHPNPLPLAGEGE